MALSYSLTMSGSRLAAPDRGPKVYLLRGFLNVFSLGLDELSAKIEKARHPLRSVQSTSSAPAGRRDRRPNTRAGRRGRSSSSATRRAAAPSSTWSRDWTGGRAGCACRDTRHRLACPSPAAASAPSSTSMQRPARSPRVQAFTASSSTWIWQGTSAGRPFQHRQGRAVHDLILRHVCVGRRPSRGAPQRQPARRTPQRPRVLMGSGGRDWRLRSANARSIRSAVCSQCPGVRKHALCVGAGAQHSLARGRDRALRRRARR